MASRLNCITSCLRSKMASARYAVPLANHSSLTMTIPLGECVDYSVDTAMFGLARFVRTARSYVGLWII